MSEWMWHVAKDGQQLGGTHTSDQVVQILQRSSSAALLVWRPGMEQWLPPDEIPELAALIEPEKPYLDPMSKNSHPPAVSTSSNADKKPGSETVQHGVGFVRSLFDLRFENLVTPKMMSALYLVSMVLVGLGLLAMLFSGLMQIVNGIRFGAWGMALFGLVWIVVSPVLATLYLALIRMFFEVVVVLFKIRDDLSTMAHRGED